MNVSVVDAETTWSPLTRIGDPPPANDMPWLSRVATARVIDRGLAVTQEGQRS